MARGSMANGTKVQTRLVNGTGKVSLNGDVMDGLQMTGSVQNNGRKDKISSYTARRSAGCCKKFKLRRIISAR